MQLRAEKREPGQKRSERPEGYIPGIVYNKTLNIPVSIEMRAFDKVFRSQGSSNIIDLEIDGATHPVLVRAVQMDKRRREPQHVDFYAVTAGQKVQVHVPIELVGTPAGVREGGLMDQQRREVHISVLPRLIPHGLELDVSGLNIGDSLHISDVLNQLPEEAEVLDDPETTVVSVLAPRVEEEVETDEATEPELVGEDEGTDDEGDA
jgi:large subunit ribosomal protein L25